jgi:hypothetical protein
MLERAFAHFDKDGSGTITKAELLEALQQVHGSDVNVDEVRGWRGWVCANDVMLVMVMIRGLSTAGDLMGSKLDGVHLSGAQAWVHLTYGLWS